MSREKILLDYRAAWTLPGYYRVTWTRNRTHGCEVVQARTADQLVEELDVWVLAGYDILKIEHMGVECGY